MSKKKYIYANIRLPIEMSDNGSFYEVFSDRMTIDFESCKTLPQPTSYENKELIAKIFAIQQTDDEEEVEEEEKEDEKEEENEKEEEAEKKEDEEQEKESESESDSDSDSDSCRSLVSETLKKEFSRQKTNKSRHNLSFRRRGKTTGNKNFTRRMY